MRLPLFIFVAGVVLFGTTTSFAQTGTPPPQEGNPDEWATPPPPLVDAPPSTEVPTAQDPVSAPVPPPPAYVPQSGQKVPYPYSPYAPAKVEEPPAEVGLIITEVLFGAITAGGTTALMALLVLPSFSQLPSPIAELLVVLALSTVPVSVAQTEVQLANGSLYYVSESWPAMLAGLLGEGIILGLYYVLGGFASAFDLTKALFLIAAHTVVLPATITVAINVFKRPRMGGTGGGLGALVRYDGRGGFQVGLPFLQPVPVMTSKGVTLGLGATLAVGRF